MKNFNNNTFIEWAIKARADVLAMSVRDQIIVYALLVAITVLSLALTYWVVKGALALTYVAVKGSLYLSYYAVVLSLLIPFALLKLVLEPVKVTIHKTIYRPVSMQKPVLQETRTEQPIPKTVIDLEKPRKFCSQCGKEFSNAMEEAMHKNGSAYCEYCGVNAEIRA